MLYSKNYLIKIIDKRLCAREKINIIREYI